ncbi:MAG: hypothetical protein GX107_07760 [Clostridiales bacterium]|jgi:hypothetical protein|nr:hypothetical protein [Clostridiales bacterium]
MYSKTIRVISFVLVLVAVSAFASCNLLNGVEEESTEAETTISALTEIPATPAETLAYFNRVMNAIKAENPGVSSERKRNIKDVKAVSAKGEIPEVASIISLAKGYMDVLGKKSETSEHGENLSDFLPVKGSPLVSSLTLDDIVTATCVQNEDDDEYYTLTVVLKDVENPGPFSPIGKAFDLDIDKSTVLEQFQNYTDNVTVSDYSALYTGCSVTISILKSSDKVTNISYNKNVVVTSDVVFNGELAVWGDAVVSLTFTETKEYKKFVWEAPTEEAAD